MRGFFFLLMCLLLTPGSSHADVTEAYVKKYRKIAVKEMKRTGVPASITLAQGILESGNGESRLAKKAKNHFGIKCTSDWNGRSMKEDDDHKDECFRRYRKVEQSYRDHSEFLAKRDRYKSLFALDATDYKGWAYGLKTAGYATNPNYPQLLISLIEKYDLDDYDKRTAKKRIRMEEKAEKQKAKEPKEREEKKAIPAVDSASYYTVQKGDTMYSISKKYNLSIDDLKRLNGKSDHSLYLGEKLRLK